MFNPKNIKHPWKLILGYFFLCVGILGIFIPFLQGWVFIILGIALLKDQASWARTWASKISLWLRKR